MGNYELAGSLGLQGKTVVVVGGGGANNGIGRATAILFAKLGAKVAVLDINSEAAAETARLINAVAENAASVWQLDALNADQVDKTLKRFGKSISASMFGSISSVGIREELLLKRFLWMCGN